MMVSLHSTWPTQWVDPVCCDETSYYETIVLMWLPVLSDSTSAAGVSPSALLRQLGAHTRVPCPFRVPRRKRLLCVY